MNSRSGAGKSGPVSIMGAQVWEKPEQVRENHAIRIATAWKAGYLSSHAQAQGGFDGFALVESIYGG
jgi:hypothetical protein